MEGRSEGRREGEGGEKGKGACEGHLVVQYREADDADEHEEIVGAQVPGLVAAPARGAAPRQLLGHHCTRDVERRGRG